MRNIHLSLLLIVLFHALLGIGGDDIAQCKCKGENTTDILERLKRLEDIVKHLIDKPIKQPSFIKRISSLIPSSDLNCTYNWTTGNCQPDTKCRFNPKLGDFTLNRMCRSKIHNNTSGVNESELGIDGLSGEGNDSSLLYKAVALATTTIARLARRVADHAPYTDEMCKWSMRTLRCVPESYCSFDYQVGDYSLHRACRLTSTAEDDNDLSDEVNRYLNTVVGTKEVQLDAPREVSEEEACEEEDREVRLRIEREIAQRIEQVERSVSANAKRTAFSKTNTGAAPTDADAHRIAAVSSDNVPDSGGGVVSDSTDDRTESDSLRDSNNSSEL